MLEMESSKRRYEEDDEEEDEMEMGDMKRKRMPAGEDIGPRLVNMIKKLDQHLNGSSVEDALENLTKILEENLDPYEGQIIHILYECAAYLPEKITIFSTLVGILNSRSSDFGERLLSKFVNELHNTFTSEDYDISIRIITFICDLGNSGVINLNSILDLLNDFVDLAIEDNTQSDFFVYATMHSLPWIGLELNEKKPTQMNDLLSRIAFYLERRRKDHIKVLQVWSDPNYPQEDYLDSLWAQLLVLKEASWLEKHILRTYVNFRTVLETSKQHQLPRLDRMILESSKNHPLPRVVFRLFNQSDCPESDVLLPRADAIERFLAEEDLNWIIDNNFLDWKICAHALLNYYRRDTIPLNYLVIETIFSQLFLLPNSPHLELFYGALLIELCRSQANTMPQVLALAAELLFQRTDTMQPICLDRFVDWFSYHLSNFEYRWSWSDWADCITHDSLHPRRIFVREVIEKCLHLSYHKKLTEFLPSEFSPIIPDEPALTYVLDDDRHPAFEKAEQFKEMIINKLNDEEMLAALEIKSEFPEQTQEKIYSADSVTVFFAVLLKLSSKTLTHSFAALTRYHNVICTLTTNNEEMQSIILRTLYESWSLHKQMMAILVDKMMKMRILDPSIVQAWVFSEEMKIEFKRSWVWEVLSSAVIFLERQRKKAMKDQKGACDLLEALQTQKLDALRQPEPELGGTANGNGREEFESAEPEMVDSSENQPRPRINAPIGGDQERMDSDALASRDGQPEDGATLSLDERITKATEQIEKLSGDLVSADESLRDVLLNICHKFTLILTEHLLNCETDGTSVETNFYNYVTGRFKYVFLKNFESMWRFESDLDKELFSSPTIGERIRLIFEQFRSLRR